MHEKGVVPLFQLPFTIWLKTFAYCNYNTHYLGGGGGGGGNFLGCFIPPPPSNNYRLSRGWCVLPIMFDNY